MILPFFYLYSYYKKKVMLILPMYTDDELVELEKEFKIKIEKLNLIKDKNSKEYKELDEETKLLYEIIHDL